MNVGRPDGKKFRTKPEVKNYLDLHPGIEASIEMFDFSLYRGCNKKRKRRQKPLVVESPPLTDSIKEEPVEESPAPEGKNQ